MARQPRNPFPRLAGSNPESAFNPAKQRIANDLLKQMSALDGAEDHPLAEVKRDLLRARAAEMGLQLVSCTIVYEAIPDPLIEALPRRDRDRIEAISRAMYESPAAQVAKIEQLADKYPGIPILRNHLAGAVEAAGDRERATNILAQALKDFPTYVFAFCNHVMALLWNGKVDEARALVEGPERKPLLHLSMFDPTRDIFHVTEAVAFSAMVGHYFIQTNRRDEAKVQLKMLEEIAPKHPQTKRLNEAMERSELHAIISKGIARLAENAKRRAERKAAKQAGTKPTKRRSTRGTQQPQPDPTLPDPV